MRLFAMLVLVMLVALPVQAQIEDPTAGITVTCDGEASFDNGVGVTVVQMRSGSQYRVTAIGLDGFDPVLAVLDESGAGLCTDDDPDAGRYELDLPSTGMVEASNLSSQILFTNNAPGAFSDVTFVVGGHNNTGGEFLLQLEGMTLSSADGLGDPFSIPISEPLIASRVPVTAYMIAVTSVFDPAIGLIDADYNVINDESGTPYICDDAGSASLCNSESSSLSGTYVTRIQGGQFQELPGGGLDAMFTVPLAKDMLGNYVNMVMSTVQETYGDYVVVFHMGTAGIAPAAGDDA